MLNMKCHRGSVYHFWQFQEPWPALIWKCLDKGKDQDHFDLWNNQLLVISGSRNNTLLMIYCSRNLWNCADSDSRNWCIIAITGAFVWFCLYTPKKDIGLLFTNWVLLRLTYFEEEKSMSRLFVFMQIMINNMV